MKKKEHHLFHVPTLLIFPRQNTNITFSFVPDRSLYVFKSHWCRKGKAAASVAPVSPLDTAYAQQMHQTCCPRCCVCVNRIRMSFYCMPGTWLWEPYGFNWKKRYCNMGTNTHIVPFSQTSAVQPRRSVSGGLVKSRFPELLLLQLEVSIGFSRKDKCNLTFRGRKRRRAHAELSFIQPLGGGGLRDTDGDRAPDVGVHAWVHPDVLTLLEKCAGVNFAIRVPSSA